MTKIIFEYSAEKNQQLIQERQISFEAVIAAIDDGQLLDIVTHPNTEKYGHQSIYVVEIDDYVYLVPFVFKDSKTVFLKTIFPSRKARKQYSTSEVRHED